MVYLARAAVPVDSVGMAVTFVEFGVGQEPTILSATAKDTETVEGISHQVGMTVPFFARLQTDRGGASLAWQ